MSTRFPRWIAVTGVAVCAVVGFAGPANAKTGSTDQPAAVAQATSASKLPADDSVGYTTKGFTNCGSVICTGYLTRNETRAVAKYLNSVTGGLLFLGNLVCGLIGRVNPRFGQACREIIGRSDFRPVANAAVANNACFQIAYANRPLGKLNPTPGWTNHPSYCFN